MTILDHAGIPDYIRRIYMMQVELERIAVEVAEHLGYQGCCGTDRPEDCGDRACPERNYWCSLECQTEPTPIA